MMIIITSKIFKKIDDDNNYIKRDLWEYLDQKYSKGSVGIPRSKNIKRDRWEYLDQKYSNGSVGIVTSKNTKKLSSLNV